jgi:hypothetical protein
MARASTRALTRLVLRHRRVSREYTLRVHYKQRRRNKKRVQFVPHDVSSRNEYEPDDLEPLISIHATIRQRWQQMETLRRMGKCLQEAVRKEYKKASFYIGDSIAHFSPAQRASIELLHCRPICVRISHFWPDVKPSAPTYDSMCASLRELYLL